MKVIAVFLLAVSFCAVSLAAEDDAAALYNSTCRSCHNSNGDGKTPASQKMVIPDLRSAAIQKMSDDELFQTIGNGAAHKQYPHTFLKKGMTSQQVRQIVEYMRTFKTSK
jgi:mono/diheme cytochrome c family protein